MPTRKARRPEDQKDELLVKIQEGYKVAQQLSAKSATAYLNQLVIDCRPEPRPFREVADPWQWTLANKIVPAIEYAARVQHFYRGPRSFWLTLPRGHDKTSFIGRLTNWVLAFSKISIECIAAAADRDQANLLLEAMELEARLNPWLQPLLDFKNYQVLGTRKKSRLKILSSDANSSFGQRPDFMVVDELTHWPKEDLWQALITGREKKAETSVMVVITNAGTLGSWQHEALKKCKASSDWFVYEAPGQISSWMTKERIEALKLQIHPMLARRVLDNQWVDPSEGQGYLTSHEIDECETEAFTLGLTRQLKGKPHLSYVAAVDYGPKKDRTVMVVMHQDPFTGVNIVDRMDVMQGSSSRRVPIRDVEDWILTITQAFNLQCLVVDPYQMEGTIQKFEGRVPIERFEPRGGKANYELAQALRSCVVNKRLAWYQGCGDVMIRGREEFHTFAQELKEVSIKEMVYGYRIINSTKGTHDDRIVAVGMALVKLLQEQPRREVVIGDYFWG